MSQPIGLPGEQHGQEASAPAVTGQAERKRRGVTGVVTGACPLAGCASCTGHNLRPDRSGNVTAQPGTLGQAQAQLGEATEAPLTGPADAGCATRASTAPGRPG
jgi:hypothetical protein